MTTSQQRVWSHKSRRWQSNDEMTRVSFTSTTTQLSASLITPTAGRFDPIEVAKGKRVVEFCFSFCLVHIHTLGQLIGK